jgi:hypothetical protein
MRVLFASGIDGFCHRYGPLHWAEQLATQGIASTVWAHTDPRLAAGLFSHDVLVLFRVPDGAWIRHVLARAAALERPTVFAVDDLIVAPDLTDVPLLRGRSDAEVRLWHDGVARYRRTLEACDALLATSEPIAAVGRALATPTHLQRAGVSAAELAIGAAAARASGGGTEARSGSATSAGRRRTTPTSRCSRSRSRRSSRATRRSSSSCSGRSRSRRRSHRSPRASCARRWSRGRSSPRGSRPAPRASCRSTGAIRSSPPRAP